mgnify:CR=1 FL=1
MITLPYLVGESIDHLVLTIPTNSTAEQRQATAQAAFAAGAEKVLLLQEPVAAALAHAQLNGWHEQLDVGSCLSSLKL